MAATFPASPKIFLRKVDLVDTVLADHVNTLQDEVTATQQALGVGILSSSWVGTYENPLTHTTVAARLGNIEAGLKWLDANKLSTSGNAPTSSSWLNARTITLTGNATGSVNIDGSGNVSLPVTVVANSHNHLAANVTDLATATQDTVGAMVSGNTENGLAVTYDNVARKLNFDVNDPSITLTGDATGTATMTNLGNVSLAVTGVQATKWTTARTLTLSGGVTGSASVDGSANVTLTATVTANSHTHVSSNITDLAATTQDTVGTMVTGSTQNGVTVSYDNVARKINFDVADPTITLSGDVTGAATMTNLGNVTIAATVGTLSNKTLNSPTINGGTINATSLQVGSVTVPTISSADTLSNKTLSSPTVNGGMINATSLFVSGVSVPTVSSVSTLTNKTIIGPSITGASITSATTITTSGAQATSARVRQITLSTVAPTLSDGTDGDVWMKYAL